MIYKKPKLINVPVRSITNDKTRNVRELLDSAYDREPLIQDLQLRGQQDPATLEKIGDVLYPLKGFRRVEAFQVADERGLKYDATAPQAGKPMDHILAYVYEDLSERERTELLLDHGQRRGLNKVELFNAIVRAFTAGYSEKDVVTLLWTLLEAHYPPDRKVGEGLEGDKLAQARLENRKGVLQIAKRVMESPTVLSDAYYKRLRGEQKWPTNSEIIDLAGIHATEMKENPLLSRNKPGPKFLGKFESVRKARTESTGTTAPKSAAMRNRTQVEDSLKTLECPITKALQKIQLGEIPVDRLPVLDKILSKFWDGGTITEEDKTEVLSWFARPTDETTPPATSPVGV